jgi:hypothetical protein
LQWCCAQKLLLEEIKSDIQVGHTGEGKTIQAIPIRGARPYMAFKQTFDELLQGK